MTGRGRWSVARRALLAAALCLAPGLASGQAAVIRGIVADSATGTPMADVAVFLEAGGERVYGTFTNRNGFYQLLGIPAGAYTLRGQLIGYAGHETAVTLSAGQQVTMSFRLVETAVQLEGIVVSPERGAAVQELGRQVVVPEEIRMVPVPGGSGDLAAYLQTLPGVTTTGDRGGQLFVRGGTPAENLVLVDGIPIYQPFHILGFYSVFPEELVAQADFFPGAFGARYQGRTSSVLDVRIRDGIPTGFKSSASMGPFLAEAVAEGSVEGATWLGFVRKSLVEETSGFLLGETQPLSFESQFFKVTSTHRRDDRCSVTALRTRDSGRLDPEERTSRVEWSNLLFGIRCINLRSNGQLLETSWSYSRSGNDAVSRGSSDLRSSVWRVQHDVHATGHVGAIPVDIGYQLDLEAMDYQLSELFRGHDGDHDVIFGASVFVEPSITLGETFEVRPGLVLVGSPRLGLEPRLRMKWDPFGPEAGTLTGGLGFYRQNVVGVSDMRDVGSVFLAWMDAPDGVAQEAWHGVVGWQQSLGSALRWSVDGYYKRMKGIPVPVWRAVAQFTTELGQAQGEVYGTDLRVEVNLPRFYGFVGYGFSRTLYEASQTEFSTWFGEPVQSYHPPHDRRHQVNVVGTLDLDVVQASLRWQFGSGLPFTRPMGFDEAFDYSRTLSDVHTEVGTTRLVLDRPYTGRLPLVHRLDLSVEREFATSVGKILARAGVINAYDRRNLFYYDLFSGRRLDQMPLAPYASVTIGGR